MIDALAGSKPKARGEQAWVDDLRNCVQDGAGQNAVADVTQAQRAKLTIPFGSSGLSWLRRPIDPITYLTNEPADEFELLTAAEVLISDAVRAGSLTF